MNDICFGYFFFSVEDIAHNNTAARPHYRDLTTLGNPGGHNWHLNCGHTRTSEQDSTVMTQQSSSSSVHEYVFSKKQETTKQ